MPTNYDALAVRLSRRLGDPASAAQTDGKRFTSALRDTFLNAAIKKLYVKYLRFINRDALAVELIEPGFFRGVLTNEGQALSSGAQTLSTWTGGVAWIVSARNSSTPGQVLPLPLRLKSAVESSVNTFLTANSSNQFYTIQTSSIKVFGSAANDTIVLDYVKPHALLVSNAGSDIVVPDHYWEQVLDLAEAIALQEFPTQSNIARAASKEAQVNKEIYG